MNVGTLGSIINLTICFAIPLMLEIGRAHV